MLVFWRKVQDARVDKKIGNRVYVSFFRAITGS